MFCSLNCITRTIQVNASHKYFPQGPHVSQPCFSVLTSETSMYHSQGWAVGGALQYILLTWMAIFNASRVSWMVV